MELRQQPNGALFLAELEAACNNQSFVRLVLSRYSGTDPELQRLVIRPVALKAGYQLAILRENKTFNTSDNLGLAEALPMVEHWLQTEFKSAQLDTMHASVQLSVSKKGKVLLSRHASAQTQSASTSHNREKQRYVEQSRPYLTALGVTDANGEVIPAMQRKWKQINKFIEILSGALTQTGLLERQQVHVADFGSGKAYLTFAVHDYLSQHGLDAKVTGVELRPALVDLCNQTAQRLNLKGLQFEQGDVQHFRAQGINVMIALHACDVATDYAIHMGIRTGAEIIMCSPCCHKELRPQMVNPAVLNPLLKHGIHQAQEAEMLTDGLRALLLEAHGYDTQVFEFISLEHTSKNKMILAQKRSKAKDVRGIWQQIEALKQFYGIERQTLQQLLQQDTEPTSSAI